MESTSLSRRDENVLEKMKDPESNPLMAVLIDSTLPKDPNIHQPSITNGSPGENVTPYRGIQGLCCSSWPTDSRVPEYASARNNRAQALRRLYGDRMLLHVEDPTVLAQSAEPSEKKEAAAMAFSDLDEAVKLLTPKSLFSSSPHKRARRWRFLTPREQRCIMRRRKGCRTGAI
ncbi:hypothetical protein PG994_001947 [Apiospora phragmitis]|uniref:Uncharacterized protein n=1 Tax=Apiospora phragmitis TaxID=2905665 RepID=A0ABR1WUY0_9PEZI